MSVDLDALRTVADAATPGPWIQTDDSWPTEVRIGEGVYDVEDPGDAAFIATFDPSMVLALVERVRVAEDQRDRAVAALREIDAAEVYGVGGAIARAALAELDEPK